MSGSDRFHVPNPNLIHDTIQGEVILLDLDTGTYYQVRDTGVLVWNLLVAGVALSEIQARLTQLYPNDAGAISNGLAHFIQELEQEKLVARLAPDAPTPRNPLELDAIPQSDFTFVPPVLLKYTDMQSLLLLDPIHDVDTPGWPIPRENERAV